MYSEDSTGPMPTGSKRKATSSKGNATKKRKAPMAIMSMVRAPGIAREQEYTLGQLTQVLDALTQQIKEGRRIVKLYTEHNAGKVVNADQLYLAIQTAIVEFRNLHDTNPVEGIIDSFRDLYGFFNSEHSLASSTLAADLPKDESRRTRATILINDDEDAVKTEEPASIVPAATIIDEFGGVPHTQDTDITATAETPDISTPANIVQQPQAILQNDEHTTTPSKAEELVHKTSTTVSSKDEGPCNIEPMTDIPNSSVQETTESDLQYPVPPWSPITTASMTEEDPPKSNETQEASVVNKETSKKPIFIFDQHLNEIAAIQVLSNDPELRFIYDSAGKMSFREAAFRYICEVAYTQLWLESRRAKALSKYIGITFGNWYDESSMFVGKIWKPEEQLPRWVQRSIDEQNDLHKNQNSSRPSAPGKQQPDQLHEAIRDGGERKRTYSNSSQHSQESNDSQTSTESTGTSHSDSSNSSNHSSYSNSSNDSYSSTGSSSTNDSYTSNTSEDSFISNDDD